MLLNGIRMPAYGAAILAALLLFAPAASAVPELPPGMPDGGCWADPMNNLSITLSSASFSSNAAGATATVAFRTLPEEYPGWCYSLSGLQSASYFSTAINAPKSTNFANFYILSDDVDYQISLNSFTDIIPFINVEGSLANAGPIYNGISRLTGGTKGNSGKIYF